MKKTLILSCFLAVSFNSIAQFLYGDYRVVIEVEGNNYAHSTQVYFDDESWDPQNPPSYGWDACCDALLVLGNAYQPHIFTEVVEPPLPANNHRLSLNALPLLFEQTEVPLGFLPGELAQFTFTFNELSSLPMGVTVELEDLAQGVTQDLLMDNTYTTWAATSDDEARFILRFNPSSVTSINEQDESKVELVVNAGQLSVVGDFKSSVTKVELFGQDGRLVLCEANWGSSNVNSLDVNNVKEGLYICRVQFADGGIVSQKIYF